MKEAKVKEMEIRDIGDVENVVVKAKRKKFHVFKGDDKRLQVFKVPFDIPQLDNILGGGFPLGRTVLLVGNFGAGKTYVAQIAIANFQRKGFTVAYVDVERRYDPVWFAKTGVDVSKLIVAQPDSGENALDICHFLVEEKTGLVIVDSVAALSPIAELEGAMEDSTVAALARLLNKGLRKITANNIADEDMLYKGTSFVVINQIRSGIGPYSTYGLPGGQGQQYFSSIILRIMRGAWLEEDGKKVGFNMKFVTDKNNLAEWPQECHLPFRFGGTIDTVGGLVELAVDLGVIKQKGPYFYYGDSEKGLQGKQALIEYIKKDAKLFEEIRAKIYAS